MRRAACKKNFLHDFPLLCLAHFKGVLVTSRQITAAKDACDFQVVNAGGSRLYFLSTGSSSQPSLGSPSSPQALHVGQTQSPPLRLFCIWVPSDLTKPSNLKCKILTQNVGLNQIVSPILLKAVQ